MTNPLSQRFLDSALELFARHGFHRTSMADVATAAGASRAALYLHFKDKTALFDSLAESLVSRALTQAEAAWTDGAGLSDNLAAMILAKDLPLFRLLHASPHGAELLAIDARLTGAHAARLDEGFVALLTARAKDAARDGADLSVFEGAAGFGAFLSAAAGGLKHESRSEDAYVRAIRRLCAVAARAAAATPVTEG